MRSSVIFCASDIPAAANARRLKAVLMTPAAKATVAVVPSNWRRDNAGSTDRPGIWALKIDRSWSMFFCPPW